MLNQSMTTCKIVTMPSDKLRCCCRYCVTGGTFALYSLICRAAGFGPFGKAQPVDMHFKGNNRLANSTTTAPCIIVYIRMAVVSELTVLGQNWLCSGNRGTQNWWLLRCSVTASLLYIFVLYFTHAISRVMNRYHQCACVFISQCTTVD